MEKITKRDIDEIVESVILNEWNFRDVFKSKKRKQEENDNNLKKLLGDVSDELSSVKYIMKSLQERFLLKSKSNDIDARIYRKKKLSLSVSYMRYKKDIDELRNLIKLYRYDERKDLRNIKKKMIVVIKGLSDTAEQYAKSEGGVGGRGDDMNSKVLSHISLSYGKQNRDDIYSSMISVLKKLKALRRNIFSFNNELL